MSDNINAPWRVQQIACAGEIWCSIRDVADDEILSTRMRGQSSPEVPRDLSRATLAAAAPELLAELEAMVQHFSWYGIKDDDDAQRLQDARAIIAKAKGEQS